GAVVDVGERRQRRPRQPAVAPDGQPRNVRHAAAREGTAQVLVGAAVQAQDRDRARRWRVSAAVDRKGHGRNRRSWQHAVASRPTRGALVHSGQRADHRPAGENRARGPTGYENAPKPGGQGKRLLPRMVWPPRWARPGYAGAARAGRLAAGRGPSSGAGWRRTQGAGRAGGPAGGAGPAAPGARLFVLTLVFPEDGGADPAVAGDIGLMAQFGGGRERTGAGLRGLLGAS